MGFCDCLNNSIWKKRRLRDVSFTFPTGSLTKYIDYPNILYGKNKRQYLTRKVDDICIEERDAVLLNKIEALKYNQRLLATPLLLPSRWNQYRLCDTSAYLGLGSRLDYQPLFETMREILSFFTVWAMGSGTLQRHGLKNKIAISLRNSRTFYWFTGAIDETKQEKLEITRFSETKVYFILCVHFLLV